jgi:inner membrane protease ATP23
MPATLGDTGSHPSTSEDTSVFKKWSRKFSVVTGLGITEGERMRELEAHQHSVCNRWKKELMNYSGFA